MNHVRKPSILTIDRWRTPAAVVLGILLTACVDLVAAPIQPQEATAVARAWLHREHRMFGPRPARRRVATAQGAVSVQSLAVRTVRNTAGEDVYHIVDLQPEGFVIVPGDDEIEPIVAFSASGRFEPDSPHTLAQLVRLDLPERLNTVRGRRSWKPGAGQAKLRQRRRAVQSRWSELRGAGKLQDVHDEGEEELVTVTGGEPDDLRIAPLLSSTWSQGSVGGQWCYNYYTPNHYVCGCVATAVAQLMRYHSYPTAGVGTAQFHFYVDGNLQYGNLRGGDGAGGPYDWGQMILHPGSSMTEDQRQTIGAVCYDVGIAVNMSYASGGSGAYMSRARNVLRSVFDYAGAALAYTGSEDSDSLADIINPNIDAGQPVLLSIRGGVGGHAVVCDGYGFLDDTAYHHLNMGWGGMDDAWYNLPDVEGYYDFDTVESCIYNIDALSSGEIVSGRIFTPDAQVMADVTVTAWHEDGELVGTDITDANGIYALPGLPPNATYTLMAQRDGFAFDHRVIAVGESTVWPAATGNQWEIDLAAIQSQGHGAISIQVTPNRARWTMVTCPEDYSGPLSSTGDLTVTAPTGIYTVAFSDLPSYITPAPASATITQGETAALVAVYEFVPSPSQPWLSLLLGDGDQ